jgi:3-deoxy-D-manno-octulosonic-acid transferase
MLFLYSLILSLGFLLMLPLFLRRRQKYAAGFRQRLGHYPKFKHGGRPVIWLHCVSVGETNAARPLVDAIHENFPDHRLVFSTTTKTGQDLAQNVFDDTADAIIYFPFDWKFSVRKALANYKPSCILLMETEIWPRFIREAKSSGTQVVIVNGRLSKKSFGRYSKVRPFISSVLADVDLALMQEYNDRERIEMLGLNPTRTRVTGNLKFDHHLDQDGTARTTEFLERFDISPSNPLIIAASTHEPEEQWLLDAFTDIRKNSSEGMPRLTIAPRHPERFDAVAEIIEKTGFTWVRRSASMSSHDKTADIILLDSIGELRAVYPLAELVFVGGSLIPHGGQSIYEPAAAGKAIVTGPHTANFEAAVKEFSEKKAIVRLPSMSDYEVVPKLIEAFNILLTDHEKRNALGINALDLMNNNRGATENTIELLKKLVNSPK